MTPSIVLDTCAVIWIAEDQPISPTARSALEEAMAQGASVLVSPMTAWEIGLLVARGRLTLSMSPHRWFERFVSVPGVGVASLTPAMLIASSFLPGDPPADPADRIVAATARDVGGILMTRDRALLTYGEAGHLRTLAC